ncbi:hypothetical protein PG987_004712 [Apiospora arundinis]
MVSLLVFQMLQMQQSRLQGMGPSIGGSSTGKMAEQKPNKCKSAWQSIQQRFRAKQPIVSPLNEWWAVAAQHNSTLSPVYLLPDELLLEICHQIKGADIHILRQTCSRFRRILSDPEFVSDTKWEWSTIKTPTVPGGESTYSSTMRRMREQAKYCVACKRQHPLLMFSPQQRKTQDGAVCVMVEGGISICPHRRVSLDSIEKWKKASITSSLCENDNPPWMLRCDICFTEFDDVLRCNAMSPTATYLSTPLNGCCLNKGMCLSLDCPPGNGSLCVQWNMPLPLGTKAALSENKANEGYWRTSNITPKFKKTRPLLSRLAQNYNELLCHHTKFDGKQMLAGLTAGLDFEASRFKSKKQNPGIILTAQGFQEKASKRNNSQYNGSDHELWSTKTQYNETDDESWSPKPITHDLCKVCRWNINVRPGDKVSGEYSWTLDKRGLSLQKHRRIAVPDLEAAPFGCIYFRWLQAMDPLSYGLTLDEELRHVTWCPDERCCNGKSRGWAGHRKALEDLTELISPEPPGPRPKLREPYLTGFLGPPIKIKRTCYYPSRATGPVDRPKDRSG